MSEKRAAVKISPALARELKVFAAERGTTCTAVAERAIGEHIKDVCSADLGAADPVPTQAAEILGGRSATPPFPEACAFCVHRAMATERVSTPETDPHHRPGIVFAFCQVNERESPSDYVCEHFERRAP